MPYQVTVKEVAVNPVAGLRLNASLATIGAVLQQGLGTVAGALGAAGVAPSGPPFVVYHDVIDERTEGEVEVCFPVPAGTPIPAGPVYYRELPGGPVASTLHHGPYQEISPAYQVVAGWIAEHGLDTHGAPREIYLNDPQSVGSPAELVTEVQFPIDRVPSA